MKKRFAIQVVVVLALLSLAAFAAVADEEHKHDAKHQEANKDVTLVGEVIDLYCYMQHPDKATGLEHAKCAQSCIKKGLPIGFLSDGVVYLIIGQEHESAADLVVGFAGTQARLKGTLIEHDGIKSIEVHSIEKVES